MSPLADVHDDRKRNESHVTASKKNIVAMRRAAQNWTNLKLNNENESVPKPGNGTDGKGFGE